MVTESSAPDQPQFIGACLDFKSVKHFKTVYTNPIRNCVYGMSINQFIYMLIIVWESQNIGYIIWYLIACSYKSVVWP